MHFIPSLLCLAPLRRLSRACAALAIAVVAVSLTAFPARAQAVIATVATGSSASAIAVNSVTNTVYVTNSGASGILTAINGTTNATTPIAVGADPDGVAVNASTNKIYVSNSGSNSVSVVDGVSGAATAVAVGVNPGAIAVNPVTDMVYVLNLNSASPQNGSVYVINGSTNAISFVVPGVNPGPGGAFRDAIAVNTSNGGVYADDFNNQSVENFFDASNTASAPTGYFPSAIAVNPVTNTWYVANIGKDTVWVTTIGGNPGRTALSTGHNPVDVAVNATTNKAYVACGDGTVTIVDGVTNATSSVAAGTNPVALAVNALTNTIYVVDKAASGTVTVIDGATLATTTVAVGANPISLAVNPSTNRVYVLNGDANGTVSVIQGATAVPSFSVQPVSETVNTGSPVVFSVATTETSGMSFQWSFNGAALSDANGVIGSSTSSLYLSAGVTAANAGAYTCTATDAEGSATSAPAVLTVVTSSTPGRLINISSRASVGPGAGIMIAGFAVDGSKTLVLRGAGPTLDALGVDGALLFPVLSLFDSANPANLVTSNAGWQVLPSAPAGVWAGKAQPVDASAADFSQVGAFGFAAGSLDAAVKVTVPSGTYSSQVAGVGGSTGVALAEVYDADPGTVAAQIVNISARAQVGTGGNILIAGFVIAGSTSQTVLIRASGPALTAFGVAGALADPQIQLFDGHQNIVASNFGWAGSPQIAGAAAKVGAFAWTDASSDDSGLLVTLPPGNYTAQVSGDRGDTGIALIEVYAVK